jgi:2,4-dienoyl-CoA reductase-like NADH-dependent reductase (Old Yellow Enzyme family)
MAPLLDSYYALVSGYREGFNLPYARKFKQALEIPVICVGGFVHREAMERALQDGDCDMISCARPLLADPYLYRHLREGVRRPECTFCNACYARANALPVDCYDPEVRTHKQRMLAAEGNGA